MAMIGFCIIVVLTGQDTFCKAYLGHFSTNARSLDDVGFWEERRIKQNGSNLWASVQCLGHFVASDFETGCMSSQANLLRLDACFDR